MLSNTAVLAAPNVLANIANPELNARVRANDSFEAQEQKTQHKYKLLDKRQIKSILAYRFAKDTHTKLSQLPLPKELKDIYKAANRIKDAIAKHEKIAIVGDYDCDGVCSSAVLAEFFDDMGVNGVIVRIPNRFKDGYGLNEDIIDELKDRDLIITVDNGITAHEAAAKCEQMGIDLVITDHHMPSETLPSALAIVNPQQSGDTFPFKEICGAQVAWYLVATLKEVMDIKDYDMRKFSDLLSLAIVADMMELRDMNRVLVREGLKHINKRTRACFEAIARHYDKTSFGFDDISFTISPLINSSGRMDDATLSYEFLRAKSVEQASKLFETIQDLNKARKDEEKALFEDSIKNVDESANIIVSYGHAWHEGVLGIVASRLAKLYKRPAIVFSCENGRAKGSARSVGRFNILELIAAQEHMLISYGGHRGAAGVVLEEARLKEFAHIINHTCVLHNFCAIEQSDEILGTIDVRAIDMELMDIISTYEPYGQKNPRPTFWLRGAKVVVVRTMGANEAHLRLRLVKAGRSFDCVFFNFDYMPKEGEFVDVLFTLSKNTYRGAQSLQLLIQEIAY